MAEIVSATAGDSLVDRPANVSVTVEGTASLEGFIDGHKFLDDTANLSPDRQFTYEGASDFLAGDLPTPFEIANGELIVNEPGEYNITYTVDVTGGGSDQAVVTLSVFDSIPDESTLEFQDGGFSVDVVSREPPRIRVDGRWKNTVTSGNGQTLTPSYGVFINGQQVDTVDMTFSPGETDVWTQEYELDTFGDFEVCLQPL